VLVVAAVAARAVEMVLLIFQQFMELHLEPAEEEAVVAAIRDLVEQEEIQMLEMAEVIMV
jgi:hypothetical protein